MYLAARSALLLCIGIALVSCIGSEPGPQQGAALLQGEGRAALNPSHDLPPGEEWTLMLVNLRNVSSTDVIIRGIAYVGLDDEGPVEVVRTRIAPFDPPDTLPASTYKTFPPVGRVGISQEGECRVLPVEDVRGFRLAPREEALVVTHFRALKAGDFDIRGHRVTYEQSGESLVQTMPVGHAGMIASKGFSYEPTEDEASCAEELGIRLLRNG